jgi:hypothetical protein
MLAQALDRLHPWALSGATRTALKDRPGLLDRLRDGIRLTNASGATARPPVAGSG